MSQAKIEEVDQFLDFNAFFTRELKPGLRPVSAQHSDITSPADGAVSEVGQITNGRIIQAKGVDYSVAQLLGDQVYAENFDGGSFATIYLSPKDYHRVHMPFSGQSRKLTYISGKLFSVNQRTAENLEGVFAINERLVARFACLDGECALIMVGAMIVGGMETVLTGPLKRRADIYELPHQSRFLDKGEEFGRFYLGSTAILLTPKSMEIDFGQEIRAGASVKMGQTLGCLVGR